MYICIHMYICMYVWCQGRWRRSIPRERKGGGGTQARREVAAVGRGGGFALWGDGGEGRLVLKSERAESTWRKQSGKRESERDAN